MCIYGHLNQEWLSGQYIRQYIIALQYDSGGVSSYRKSGFESFCPAGWMSGELPDIK